MFPQVSGTGTAGRVFGTANFFGDFGDKGDNKRGWVYRWGNSKIYIEICKYTCHSYETKHKACHLNIIEP